MKAKLISLIILLLACSMALAIDPWGDPTVLTGSMTVMAQVTLNGAPASSGDVLGAFVSVGGVPQLRGKATVMINGGIAGCLIQIYTETNGETISFKVWDDSASIAYDAAQTLPSEVNGIVGSYPDNLYQITAGQTMVTDPWPEPAVLTGSMTVMAQVSINGVPATNEDILAAFVTVGGQEQLRGKGDVMVNNGIAGCLLQVFTDTNGESVSFKVWDYSAQQILSSSQTLVSEVEGIIGSWPDNLYQINATNGVQQVATPTFNPVAGIYQTAQSVTLTCTTPGATIRYTTNGTDPTETSTMYTTPIACPLNSSTTIKARGFLSNWTPSVVATAQYIITGTVATPTFNPVAGTYPTVQNVSISCATSGATIRYTTDGTEPTATSTIYSTPIVCPLNSSTTIKAKGFLTNWTPSATATAVYVVTGTVETPVLNPPAGTYTEAQVVSITCATAGAQIRYTTNGTEPTASSPLYTGPLTITTTTTIKAKGFLTNWTPSATVTGVYTITGTVATPTFNPPAGTYQTAQNVSISCATPGATIRYTTDGTDPTATSTIYTAPIACPLNSSTTIKAKAFKTDWTPSTIASATYVITGMVATPALNPPAGTYQTAQSVSITCATAGATIRYTTNGTDPTETSTIYTAPIACPLNATTVIKARGFLTNWSPSPVTTGIYVITGTVAAPEFNPPAGDYDDPIAVQISCSTPGAEIRYTTDDSEPTAASTLYTAPISIDQDTTIKAKAFMPDWTPSPTVTAVYNISSAVGDEHAVPLYTGIHGVYPNPFSAQTTIRMGFKEANSTYSLRIFNIRGEMVFQTNGHATGYADYNWNGCDNRGSRLSAGIYLVSLQSNGTTQTRKLVLK